MKEIKEPEAFFQLQAKFKKFPFTQSLGWYNYIKSQGGEVVFYTDNENDPNILIWGTCHKIPFYKKKILKIEGETYKPELTEKVFRSFYSKIISNHQIVEINSNNPYNIEFEIGVRRAGFKRPLGLFACPLTIEIDLEQAFTFDNNWKRNVRKANKHALRCTEIENVSEQEIKEIVRMFDELAELKNLGYRLEKYSLETLLKSRDIRTFLVYDSEDLPVAARIIHHKKPYSTDIFAANSLNARKCGATYFIMQSILEKLKKEKYLLFDFGRIPPSNHHTDSVYTFKNASRGNKIQYNGEWTYYRDRKTEVAMFLYKWLKLNKQRY